MELTKQRKNQLSNAKSSDEIDTILAETKKSVEEAGLILDDTDLDIASGGLNTKSYEKKQRKPTPCESPN